MNWKNIIQKDIKELDKYNFSNLFKKGRSIYDIREDIINIIGDDEEKIEYILDDIDYLIFYLKKKYSISFLYYEDYKVM